MDDEKATPRPRPVDDTSIPFGEIREVMGAMDLRKKVKIGTLVDDLEDDWIGMWMGWFFFF